MHLYLSQMNKQLKAKQISQCNKCSILSRSTIEMGQVQNGCLYIRYRSSSQKNEAEECKKPTDYIDLFAILMINLLYKFPQPLIQLRVGFCFKPLPQQAISNWFTLASVNGVPFKAKKPNMKIFDFVHLLSSSFSPSSITQKLYGMCEYYVYQITTLLMEIIPTCFEFHVSYNWQATALKLSPTWFGLSPGHFFGFSPNNCVHDTYMYNQATPGVLNACITGCDEFARNYV